MVSVNDPAGQAKSSQFVDERYLSKLNAMESSRGFCYLTSSNQSIWKQSCWTIYPNFDNFTFFNNTQQFEYIGYILPTDIMTI